MATSRLKNTHLPDELLKQMFSFLQPPLPEVLGRARYEHIEFVDADVEAVGYHAGTHQDEWLPRLKNEDEQYKIGLMTLGSCTRVCKRFERIVRPLLYESYPGQPIAGLQACNRTLIRRPDLARMVKYITIGCWEINMLQGLERWWKSTIQKVGFGQKLLPALLGKAEAGHEDAQVALLLFLCINVEAVDLSVPVLFHMSVVKGLVKEIAQERPNTYFRGEHEGLSLTMPDTLPLRKLRSLGLREGDTSLTVGVGAFDVLLRLPTITSLTLHRLSCARESLPPMPQLQDLCLWRCQLDDKFCQSLKICKALRTLKIIWPGMCINYMQDVYAIHTTIDYEYIGTIVSESFPLLECLVLDPREAHLFGNSCTQLHRLDLSSMANLKELAVEVQALWGNQIADDRISRDVGVPFPRLQHILPPLVTKFTVLVNRRGEHQHIVPKGGELSQRNQILVVIACLTYLVDAPSSLQSLHLDIPWPEIQQGFAGLEELFENLGFVHSVSTADFEVQRASPVVGVATPKEQRLRLRDDFSVWLPDADSWHTVVIRKSGYRKVEADLQHWRAVLEDKVEEASGLKI